MTENKKKSSESRFFADSFDRGMNEEDLMYKSVNCCNMAYDSSSIGLNPSYVTTAYSTTDSLSSAMDDLRDQFEMLKNCVNASAVSADELGAGLKAVCNKMQTAGRVFKTHLKRSELHYCF